MAFSVGAISANVTADQSGFNTAINDIHKKGVQAASAVEQQFQKVGDSFVSAGKKLTTRVTAPLVALAGLSVKAFDTQIQAEKRLEAQLKATGEEVQSNMADFKQYAAGLQEITTVGDESTLQMIQVAKSMGLTNDQAKRAAKNSIALAKAMGMNEQSAIRYAAALEQGQVTMLSRYLPGLREIEDMSERAAKAQELLSDMFGAATAEAQNGLGPLTQIKNTLGDFSEVVGDIVLNKMQPLISGLKDTANWLKGLDRQSQETLVGVGGVAAAIGPATLGLGWAIKLTIPAVKTLIKVTKTLTAAMVSNPYFAVAVAIALIGVKSHFTNKRIQELHDSISDILEVEIGELGLDQVNKKIDETAKRIKEIEDGMVGAAVSSNKEWQRLNEQLDQLVDLRDEIAGRELRMDVAMGNLEETQKFLDFINTDFQALINTATANSSAIAKPFVAAKRSADEVIQAIDMVTKGFQEMTSEQILADSGNINIPEKMFPPGSLGFVRQEIQKVQTKLQELVVGSEDFNKAKERLAGWRSELVNLQTHLVTTEDIMQNFATTVGDAFAQAALHSKSLMDNLTSIGKQLASKAIITALQFLLPGGPAIGGASFFGKLFGGSFHTGGIVSGSGDKLINAKGGEGVFTQGQMRALGNNMNNGGGFDMRKLKQAFSQALEEQGRRIGPEEIFILSKRGQDSF